MLLKSFLEFINESYMDDKDFINTISLRILQKVRSYGYEQSESYYTPEKTHFAEPFEFDLSIKLRKISNFDASNDEHFKSLPWENINFSRNGFVIDANTTVPGDLGIPEIKLFIVTNPNEEPHSYSKLHAKLIDILTHETTHLEQIGKNWEPFNEKPSNHENREDAKKDFKYFLLNDEVESMVSGMHARSKHSNIPLDHIFDDYLIPFVQSKYITQSEYSEIIETWVKFALEKYPDTTFSNKVDPIINSI
jgi:hypothetical protein